MIDKVASRGINNVMNRAIIYARKSTDEKTKQIKSIDDQLIICNRIVKENNLTLIAPPFVESRSGWRADERIEFPKILKPLQTGQADSLVMCNFDRNARNYKENGILLDLMEKGKIKIYTESEILDDEESLKTAIQGAINVESSRKLSKIVKSRLRLKAERGDFSGVAPIGYLNTPKKLKGTREIIIDKKRVELVRKWWELFLTGKYTVEDSLSAITKKGLRNRKGKIISRTTAHSMFRNIFYTGKFKYGGEEYFGNHKPIVTMSEWLRVQRFLDRKGKKGNGTLQNPEETAFRGILKCGECGCAITMQKHIKNYKNGVSQVFWYYSCTKRRNKIKKCTQKYLNAKDFDTQLKAYLDNIKLNPPIYRVA